jgi:hypothetical protein
MWENRRQQELPREYSRSVHLAMQRLRLAELDTTAAGPSAEATVTNVYVLVGSSGHLKPVHFRINVLSACMNFARPDLEERTAICLLIGALACVSCPSWR